LYLKPVGFSVAWEFAFGTYLTNWALIGIETEYCPAIHIDLPHELHDCSCE